MPVFFRSEGPFNVYDHGLKTTRGNFTASDLVTIAHLGRHENEIARLKEQREAERNQFYTGLELMTARENEATNQILENRLNHYAEVKK